MIGKSRMTTMIMATEIHTLASRYCNINLSLLAHSRVISNAPLCGHRTTVIHLGDLSRLFGLMTQLHERSIGFLIYDYACSFDIATFKSKLISTSRSDPFCNSNSRVGSNKEKIK